MCKNTSQLLGKIIFELKNEGIVNSIEIISLNGKLMEFLTVNKNRTIVDLSNYAKGSYIAQLTLNDNTLITTRIIK